MVDLETVSHILTIYSQGQREISMFMLRTQLTFSPLKTVESPEPGNGAYFQDGSSGIN